MTKNSINHARTKHIEIDLHFIPEKVSQVLLMAKHVPSTRKIASALTKPLSRSLINTFCYKLGIHCMNKLGLKGANKQ